MSALTGTGPGGRIPAMFGSKRKKQQQEQQPEQAPQPTEAPRSVGGYVVTELPTFHGRERRVVVYTSDSSGKIVKRFKR